MKTSTSTVGAASASERAHLEEAHHELCTALTSLRSNMALVRSQLRNAASRSSAQDIVGHLDEVETAVARLERLAGKMCFWHDACVA